MLCEKNSVEEEQSSTIYPDTIYEYHHPYSTQVEGLIDQITLSANQYESMQSCLASALKQVKSQGAVIIEDTPLEELATLKQWCLELGEPMNYEGGTNVRENKGQGVLSVGTEPPWANVATHNEMSYSFIYPELFVIGCKEASPGAAPTIVGDNAVMTDLLLALPLGKKLMEKRVRYIRNFHDQNAPKHPSLAFASWQSVFNTDDPSVVSTRAQERLSGAGACDVQHLDNGSIRIIYDAPAYEFDAALNRNLCFVSIGNHGYWFRQWSPYNLQANMDRPFHLQFGDGSEFSEEELSIMAQIGNASSFPIHWQAGKMAILDNRRYTHARPQYVLPEGAKRELGVVLLNPVSRQGAQLGKY